MSLFIGWRFSKKVGLSEGYIVTMNSQASKPRVIKEKWIFPHSANDIVLLDWIYYSINGNDTKLYGSSRSLGWQIIRDFSNLWRHCPNCLLHIRIYKLSWFMVLHSRKGCVWYPTYALDWPTESEPDPFRRFLPPSTITTFTTMRIYRNTPVLELPILFC